MSSPNSRNNHNSQRAAASLIDITLIPGTLRSVVSIQLSRILARPLEVPVNLNRLADSFSVEILMYHDYPDKAVQRRRVKLADVHVFLDCLNPSHAVDFFLLPFSQPLGLLSDPVLQRRLFCLLLFKNLIERVLVQLPGNHILVKPPDHSFKLTYPLVVIRNAPLDDLTFRNRSAL